MTFLNIIAKYFPKWNTSEDFGIIHCNLENYIFPLYESFKARKWKKSIFCKKWIVCIYVHSYRFMFQEDNDYTRVIWREEVIFFPLDIIFLKVELIYML